MYIQYVHEYNMHCEIWSFLINFGLKLYFQRFRLLKSWATDFSQDSEATFLAHVIIAIKSFLVFSFQDRKLEDKIIWTEC
jgi:hypothetical protein